MSAAMVYFTGPIPPSLMAVLRQALWVKWLSMDTLITSTPRSLNASMR